MQTVIIISLCAQSSLQGRQEGATTVFAGSGTRGGETRDTRGSAVQYLQGSFNGRGDDPMLWKFLLR